MTKKKNSHAVLKTFYFKDKTNKEESYKEIRSYSLNDAKERVEAYFKYYAIQVVNANIEVLTKNEYELKMSKNIPERSKAVYKKILSKRFVGTISNNYEDLENFYNLFTNTDKQYFVIDARKIGENISGWNSKKDIEKYLSKLNKEIICVCFEGIEIYDCQDINNIKRLDVTLNVRF
jgi:hydroxymethylpyrimidine pyrophosphatase-like HAD family hydrolase